MATVSSMGKGCRAPATAREEGPLPKQVPCQGKPCSMLTCIILSLLLTNCSRDPGLPVPRAAQMQGTSVSLPQALRAARSKCRHFRAANAPWLLEAPAPKEGFAPAWCREAGSMLSHAGHQTGLAGAQQQSGRKHGPKSIAAQREPATSPVSTGS